MKRLTSAFMRLGIIGGISICVGIADMPVHAAEITFNFTGTVGTGVNDVHTQLDATFPGSTAMTGWAKVNTSGSGTYTMTGFNVTIGGYNATFGPSGSVIITNVTSGQDRFLLQAQSPVGASISVPGGSVSPLLFNIDLKGPATLFSSNALPSSLPSISSFSNLNSWRLVFGTGQGRIVSGTLTALTAVPLPAAVVLFGAGLVALAGLGAGSWRQRKNHITA